MAQTNKHQAFLKSSRRAQKPASFNLDAVLAHLQEKFRKRQPLAHLAD